MNLIRFDLLFAKLITLRHALVNTLWSRCVLRNKNEETNIFGEGDLMESLTFLSPICIYMLLTCKIDCKIYCILTTFAIDHSMCTRMN